MVKDKDVWLQAYDIGEVDLQLFHFSLCKAKLLDANQRLLLEVTYQTFKDAGIILLELNASRKEEHRMTVTNKCKTQDDLECVNSGSGSKILTWFLTRHSRLKQMIKTANFQGKKLREVELSDKELFYIAVDPTWMMLALVGADKLIKLVDFDDGKTTFIGH
ncbi:MAG: hypothetical protein EZS28_019070 [Streblomastix strix]|uniref:Beta-ketoacyl synthase-like N-terminal domain-containing protein n=1 Tax=Streblomastix strix TaxID=222440 RepID=A0A5J4VS13_9EUKA|nr:MAG: hypothetical protein EZS28_019070 [Streblomastix strix]